MRTEAGRASRHAPVQLCIGGTIQRSSLEESDRADAQLLYALFSRTAQHQTGLRCVLRAEGLLCGQCDALGGQERNMLWLIYSSPQPPYGTWRMPNAGERGALLGLLVPLILERLACEVPLHDHCAAALRCSAHSTAPLVSLSRFSLVCNSSRRSLAATPSPYACSGHSQSSSYPGNGGDFFRRSSCLVHGEKGVWRVVSCVWLPWGTKDPGHNELKNWSCEGSRGVLLASPSSKQHAVRRFSPS